MCFFFWDCEFEKENHNISSPIFEIIKNGENTQIMKLLFNNNNNNNNEIDLASYHIGDNENE